MILEESGSGCTEKLSSESLITAAVRVNTSYIEPIDHEILEPVKVLCRMFLTAECS